MLMEYFIRLQSIKSSFKPKSTWGPRALSDKREWQEFKAKANEEMEKVKSSRLKHIWISLTGGYRKNK